MLRRILQNLMANAVQYTDRGCVRLFARPRGEMVRIEVWDTGPGIGEADRETIFEEFQRGAATDRPTVGGFGLGLSIVQRMAEALGHRLDLCSRVGHGTRFSVTVPRALTEIAGTRERVTEAPAPVDVSVSSLEGAEIAVIDNDPGVLEAMRSLLERWGCRVRSARSLEGLARAEGAQRMPDVILADYHLDERRNGLEAVHALRRAAGAAIPAIVITADRTAEIADAAREMDCEVLLKPVKPARLRALMLHLLARAAHGE